MTAVIPGLTGLSSELVPVHLGRRFTRNEARNCPRSKWLSRILSPQHENDLGQPGAGLPLRAGSDGVDTVHAHPGCVKSGG